MKATLTRTLLLFLLIVALAAGSPAVVRAQSGTETPTVTATSTQTGYPAPTESPKPTAEVQPTATEKVSGVVRPMLVIESYDTGDATPTTGAGFDLHLYIKNVGRTDAYNVVITFASSDFYATNTGGVQAFNIASAGYSFRVTQPMITSTSMWGGYGSVAVTMNYNDPGGTPYTDSFTLSLGTRAPSSSSKPTATATPTGRAQMAVGGYESSLEILQPGSIFDLKLTVRNLGVSDAHGVTMVLGGGATAGDNGQGTPSPGGISGAGSDVSIFAPLGQSNVVFLGDIPAGSTLDSSNHLIVNVSAAPGAYPFKISFVYNDDRNVRVVDDQVITMLIYSLPNVEVSFYSDPGVFFVGQPGPLPLQVTNLSKKPTVLGNMRVSSTFGDIQNNVSLVGSLDSGGYFPLDAMFTPNQPGEAEINITINYTDDFNQPREIAQTLKVNVQEGGGDMGMPTPMVGPDGSVIPPDGGIPGGDMGGMVTETFWQKVVRAFKGLLGLDSAVAQPVTNPEMPMMPTEPQISKPIPKG